MHVKCQCEREADANDASFADILSSTMLFAVPLLLVALGGMFSERSGIINIALEGIMIIGALISCLVLCAAYGRLKRLWSRSASTASAWRAVCHSGSGAVGRAVFPAAGLCLCHT